MKIIKDLYYGIKALAGLDWIDKAVEQLQKVSAQFRDEEKKVLQCIIEADEKIAIAVNDAKNVVSDVKSLCTPLNKVINSKASSNNNKICLAISKFKESMDCFLPKLENARDGLSKVTAELDTIVLQNTNLKTWCFGKKQEQENVKNSSVVQVRVAHATVNATVTVACTAAAVCLWNGNPLAWVPGTAAGFAAITIGVTESATIPQLRKMNDDKIKELEKSITMFQEMSKKNKERSKSLTEELQQLRKITSVAIQAKDNASATLEFDENDIMFNILKENVKELECLCDTCWKK